jgi:hypothetical protein
VSKIKILIQEAPAGIFGGVACEKYNQQQPDYYCCTKHIESDLWCTVVVLLLLQCCSMKISSRKIKTNTVNTPLGVDLHGAALTRLEIGNFDPTHSFIIISPQQMSERD